MTIFRLLFFIALTLCTATAQQVGEQRVTSTSVTGVLSLPDGSKFKTSLYGMKVIGQLRTTKKVPYFILSGTTCTGCDENVSIYIHSPSDGPMKNEAEQLALLIRVVKQTMKLANLSTKLKCFLGTALQDT